MLDKNKIVLNVSVADGKYRVIATEDGKLRSLRHGEKWARSDLTGDGLVLALAQEIRSLREKLTYDENVSMKLKGAPSMAITDDELLSELDSIRRTAEARLDGLRKRSVEVVDELYEDLIHSIKSAGRIPCDVCGTTGKVARLDAGVMRKFGMREWNGCKNCGGDGNEVSGRGFLEKTE